jgi:hypothetical protein
MAIKSGGGCLKFFSKNGPKMGIILHKIAINSIKIENYS